VQDSSVSKEEYLVIAKLTAILRTANSLDRSHRQRIQDIKVSIRDGNLVITALTDEDLTLEQGTLAMEDSLFEEVFNLRTVLRQKRRV
jgi:exopolyphosphatase/guanosine-5'-triphosphate,3'-diphosphate pyrophosphatase